MYTLFSPGLIALQEEHTCHCKDVNPLLKSKDFCLSSQLFFPVSLSFHPFVHPFVHPVFFFFYEQFRVTRLLLRCSLSSFFADRFPRLFACCSCVISPLTLTCSNVSLSSSIPCRARPTNKLSSMSWDEEA